MTSIVGRSGTIKQCAILAGGLATRLGDISADTPKPVLDVGGRPFVAWIMREMLRFGVEEFLFLTGHLSDRLQQAVLEAAKALPRTVQVTFSQEPNRAGTGGALWHAAAQLHDRFLLCNGDSLFACNIAALLAGFAGDGADVDARMIVREVPDAGRYGTVVLTADRVVAFRERPVAGLAASPGVINAGIYAMHRRVLERLGPSCSLERDLFVSLAQAGRLRATPQSGWFIDIGIPEDLALARQDLAGSMTHPALVLDPSVLFDHGAGAAHPPGLRHGVREAVARAVSLNWHVFAVTGQAAADGTSADRTSWGEVGADWSMGQVADALRAAGGTLDDWRCGLGTALTEVDRLNGLVDAWGLHAADCLVISSDPAGLQAGAAAGMKTLHFEGDSLFDTLRPQLLQV